MNQRELLTQFSHGSRVTIGFAVPLAERWCWCIMMIAMDFNHCVATEGGVNEIHKSRVWFAGWWWLKMNPNDDLRRRSLPKEFAFLCVGYLCGNLKSGCTGFVTQSHLHAAVDGPSIRSPRCLYNLSNSSVCVCVCNLLTEPSFLRSSLLHLLFLKQQQPYCYVVSMQRTVLYLHKEELIAFPAAPVC